MRCTMNEVLDISLAHTAIGKGADVSTDDWFRFDAGCLSLGI